MKFKIGDKVRILPSAIKIGVWAAEVGKIGIVTSGCIVPDGRQFLQIKMLNLCKGKYRRWSVSNASLCPAVEKNEQLLFGFME